MDDRQGREPAYDPLAEILQAAGPRRPPPQAHYDEVFAAARAAWQRKLRSRRTKRWLALAASVLAIVTAGALVVTTMTTVVPDTLTVANSRGVVEHISGDAPFRTRLEPGDRLSPADGRIRTGENGGIALMLAAGGSLRLGSDSELAIERGSYTLVAGLLYFDSSDRPASLPIAIDTPFGTVRDIGTQFELRAATDTLRLRVRSGEIALGNAPRGIGLRRGAGADVEVSAEGILRERTIAPDDTAWGWAETLATAPAWDRRPIFDYLSWIAHELGRELEFDAPALELQARRENVSGDPSGLTPLELLETIAATSTFGYELTDDGTILIRRAEQP